MLSCPDGVVGYKMSTLSRMPSPPRTIVYIDGFNFYYGAVKDTPYKWLDFEAFCRLLLPRDNVVKIRYFTARISALLIRSESGLVGFAARSSSRYVRALSLGLSCRRSSMTTRVRSTSQAAGRKRKAPAGTGACTQPPKRLGGCSES